MYGVYVKLTMKDRLRRRKRNPHLSVLSLSICSPLVRERVRWWWFKEEESSSPICSLLAWEEERGCIQNAADTTKKHKLLYLSPRVPTTFASTIRSTTRKARQPTRGRPLSLSLFLSLSLRCLSPSMGKRFFRRRGRRRFLQQAAAAATLAQGPVSSSSSRRAERDTRGAWRRTDGTNGKAHSGIQWTKVHQRFKANHDTYASCTFFFN